MATRKWLRAIPGGRRFQRGMRRLQIDLSEKKASLEKMCSNKNVEGLQAPTPEEQTRVESITKMDERLKLCNSLNNDDLKLGTILASSGFRTSRRSNHNLDWALIEIDDRRMGENKVRHPSFA